MDMSMFDRLACRATIVQSDVECLGPELVLQVFANLPDSLPKVLQFVVMKVEDACHMLARDDEGMVLRNRKLVAEDAGVLGERDAMIV